MLSDRAPRAGSDALPFWEGCDERVLRIQRCTACHTWNWFPRHYCRQCSSSDLAWLDTSGVGVVEELTVVQRAMNETFKDEVPYVLALIRLDEGPLMLSRLEGEWNLEAAIGDRVQVSFVDTEGHALPVFELARAANCRFSP